MLLSQKNKTNKSFVQGASKWLFFFWLFFFEGIYFVSAEPKSALTELRFFFFSPKKQCLSLPVLNI